VGNAKNGGIDGVKNQSGKCEGLKGLGGGLDGLNNWSGKCEGPRGGGRRGKEPEWEMQRTGGGGATIV
jgi:hypothetical protein